MTPIRVTPDMLAQHQRLLGCKAKVERAPDGGWQVTVEDRLLRHHRWTGWGARRLAWAELARAARDRHSRTVTHGDVTTGSVRNS